MVNRALLLVVMAVLSLLTFVLLKGDGPGSGDVLLTVTRDNGVNQNDVPIIGLWLVGMGCCVAVWWRSR